MPFGAAGMSNRIGTSLHEPMDPVAGSRAGSGYTPQIMSMLGAKKPWTPGKAGGMSMSQRFGQSLHVPQSPTVGLGRKL